MRAEELMSHPVITCNVNDPLEVAAKLMWDEDIGSIVVVREDGKLAGMITDRDVCMAAFTQSRSLDQLLAHAAMSSSVIAATPDTPLADILRTMAERQIRRIPIVDVENRPIGLVSLNDIANEAIQPDPHIKNPFAHVALTLGAIGQPRHAKRAA
jgi:CBS domain-containing protein